MTKDRYGRTVGLVYINGQCLNEELVRAGFAWVYIKYCKKAICTDWRRLEAAAKANKNGLWSHTNPIPPWEYRHSKSRSSHIDYTRQADTQSVIYHGNVKSKVLHAPGCKYYNCKNCTAVFNSRGEAIRLGYRPCKLCQP